MDEVLSYLQNINNSEHSKYLFNLRKMFLDLVPGATEAISYGMPALKLNGKYLVGYCSFKDHMSIFPGAEPIEKLKNDLRHYKTSKGTIQITVENSIKLELLEKIVAICVERNEKSAHR